MSKLFHISLLFLATLLFAQTTNGVEVKVELVSGTTQKAQFLGIENDTVSLGGYIKDKFTVIRIAKGQFKSIVDAQGKNLLDQATPKAEASKAASSTAAADSVKVTAKDTTQVAATKDTTGTATENAAAAPSSSAQDSTAEPLQVARVLEGKKIFAGIEPANVPKQKAAMLTAITTTALTETDPQYMYSDSKSFTHCDDNTCVQKEWAKLGASEVIFGKLTYGKTPDSLELQLKRVLFDDSLPTIKTETINISSNQPITDVMAADKLKNILFAIQGKESPKSNTKSYIRVETDPEGATISRPEKDAICKTPCTFATLDTGKIVLNAYWKVEHLWGAQTTIRTIPGDTVKVSLKLKKISPEIRIMTHPSGAEIYKGSETITKESTPLAYTPDKFIYNDPGMASVRLRREGYKDTLVNFYMAPVPETNVNIELEEIKDFDEIQAQKEFFQSRKIYNLGKTLMGSALAPVLIGTIFLYLGNQDYNKAKDLKTQLELPGDPEGENYKRKMKENRDYAESGDNKMIAGGSLIGAGILLFGIGLYLTF